MTTGGNRLRMVRNIVAVPPGSDRFGTAEARVRGADWELGPPADGVYRGEVAMVPSGTRLGIIHAVVVGGEIGIAWVNEDPTWRPFDGSPDVGRVTAAIERYLTDEDSELEDVDWAERGRGDEG